MDVLMRIFSVVLLVIKIGIGVYLLASFVVFLLSLWLKRKMQKNAHHDVYHFHECPWYLHPATPFDRFAKYLVHSGFINICDSAATTAAAILICVGFLIAALIVAS